MRLEIPYWSSHHNMLLYSLFYYCEGNKIEFELYFNTTLPVNGALLYFKNISVFFDFSDDTIFIGDPKLFQFYFNRSLLESNFINVYPLNFQVNLSYKALGFIQKLKIKDIINNKNRIEIVRAIDYFNRLTNLSHNAMDVRFFPKKIIDNKGKVIFLTRLWNPNNHPDPKEKERRIRQNIFRVESCRIIKKNFKNSLVGLFPDEYSKEVASDLLLDSKATSKKRYFNDLQSANIGIADDGLKDTPGWKIGEYLMFGKAVISTPINIIVEEFKENKNYLKLSSRNSFDELPEKIDYLLTNNRYLEMGVNNFNWSSTYLHPNEYMNRIISIITRK